MARRTGEKFFGSEADYSEYAIDGLLFKLSCVACPEQFDVIDGRGKSSGYVRLRHGELRVDYPGCLDENILHELYGHGECGVFESEEDRVKQLTRIAGVIKEHRRK